MNPIELNTSSFHILQQQAVLVQQADPNHPTALVVVAAAPPPTEAVQISTNGGLLTATNSITSVSGPSMVDHCNEHGGFHDGLLDVVAMDNEEDYVDDVSELNSLEGAAFQSRLQPEKMSPEEIAAFPDVVEQSHRIPVYLYTRNSILKFWYQNPRSQVLLENIYRRLEPPFNGDHYFITRIYNYLERNGYVNFGIFEIVKEIFVPKKPKIIVIGAGIAGLIAARQLKYFGFDVFVLESRNRIGGRVCTYKQGKFIADVGATVVTGLGGNPMRVLEKQISMKLKRINQKCPLYFNDQVIDKTKDEVLETVFNTLLEGTSVLSHQMKFNKINGKTVSLGTALDMVVELQEREVKNRYLKHVNDILMLEEKLSQNLDQMKTLQECIDKLYEKHKDYAQSRTQRFVKQDYAYRVNRVQLSQAIEQHNKARDNVKRIEEKIRESEVTDVAREYLNPGDRRILDWHFANLEFATATSLKKLSLQHWDQDDAYEFTGPQIAVKNGFSCIPYALADNVDVKLNSVVRSVRMVQNGVEVQTVNIEKYNNMYDCKGLSKKLNTAPVTTFLADAVLCTLPLGVLKNSVAPQSEPNPNQIDFKPPLPDSKIGAINRLGYGNLNKVVLIFDSVFWDKNIHLFGHVSNSSQNRGELFLFWALYKQPVLMALIAGDAANILEKVEDEIIKEKCLNILSGIFSNMSNLKNYYVTRWKSDPWSLGSYSYVATDSSGNDYDLLAEPVSYTNGAVSTTLDSSVEPGAVPRLFFAGEHTIREYPATVHGALLSGVREAAKIANHFLGVPNTKK